METVIFIHNNGTEESLLVKEAVILEARSKGTIKGERPEFKPIHDKEYDAKLSRSIETSSGSQGKKSNTKKTEGDK